MVDYEAPILSIVVFTSMICIYIYILCIDLYILEFLDILPREIGPKTPLAQEMGRRRVWGRSFRL